MTKQQLIRLDKVLIVATAIMLAFEVIFAIPAISNFFANAVTSNSGWVVYVIIWAIMFLQCTILNIPAYTILSASIAIGINTLTPLYIGVVLSAYMAGCILAYWLGRWFGVKAVRWCAGSEDEFAKWSNFINQKGKWIYFGTVLLPLFPDDMLCIVCGATKMHFGFFTIANLIGRGIGLVTMLVFLKLVGSIGGGGIPIMAIVWAVCLIAEIVALLVLKSHKKVQK